MQIGGALFFLEVKEEGTGQGQEGTALEEGL